MIKRDKIIVELILLFIVFLLFYTFSSELSGFFHNMESSFNIKPLQALFWFLSILFKLFGNWIFSFIAYLIVGVGYCPRKIE